MGRVGVVLQLGVVADKMMSLGLVGELRVGLAEWRGRGRAV